METLAAVELQRQRRDPVPMIPRDARRVEGVSIEREGVEPERNAVENLAGGLGAGANRQQVGDLALGPRGLWKRFADGGHVVRSHRWPSFRCSNLAVAAFDTGRGPPLSPASCPRERKCPVGALSRGASRYSAGSHRVPSRGPA